MSSPSPSLAVFDLGGVLFDWNPRYLYRKLFNGDEAAMETFLAEVCTGSWHARHDAGISFAENAAPLIAQHPDKADLIKAWGQRYDEMFKGAIKGSVDILTELRARNTPLYALSNIPVEAIPIVEKLYPFLDWFDGSVFSGREKAIKPDPQIYRILMARYDIEPQKAVFIDDSEKNVAAAQDLGFSGVHFSSPKDLRHRLRALNLL